MDKEEVKEKLRAAVEANAYRGQIKSVAIFGSAVRGAAD